MRKDMARVVTESPRRGHQNPSKKWGRRPHKNEYDLDDHGASRAPIARHHQYGWNANTESVESKIFLLVLIRRSRAEWFKVIEKAAVFVIENY